MKRIFLALVVLGSLPAAAYANCETRKNTEFPCDPDLVRSGYYAREEYYAQLNTPVRGPFTTEEINRALERNGHPEYKQIGRSRVLNGDDDSTAEVTETRSTTVKMRTK